MVATRNHPSDFQEPSPTPEPSPRKRTTRASGTASTTNNTSPSKTSPPPTPVRARAPRAKSHSASTAWSHTPSNLTLLWLLISLPLVIWDTGYVLLRPHSMEGGWAHKPLWTLYKLYGEVDHTYGWKAYNAHSGFTAAQGSLNAIETAAYGVYLYLVWVYGRQEAVQGTGAPDKEELEEAGLKGRVRRLAEARTVEGVVAARATLLAYTAAQITFWKTVLYWLNEAFSGFDNIGHNDFMTLFWMWIVPNGAWLVLPAYMMYVFGREILQGLELATTASTKQQ